MDNNLGLSINVDIPFRNKKEAKVAYDVLRVDIEPKRSRVTKCLTLNDNILQARFHGPSSRKLRVSLNGFFDKIDLITETADTFGVPVCENYSHY